MIYLLDTNVISETIKPLPNPTVMKWLESIPMHNMSISVIVLGEIRKGVEMMNDTPKKYKIMTWLEIDLKQQFHGRVIPVDEAVAAKWGYICTQDPATPISDSLIAASAIVHNLKLVTRNINGFSRIPGLEVINPWEFL